MADLSQLFGTQNFQAMPQNVNPFDLYAPKAAEFKRKIALREAVKAGISPDNQPEFLSFVGNRLAQLGDGEGATAIAGQLQALQQQALENQNNERRLGQFDRGLDINQQNADVAGMNAELALSRAEREAGYTRDFESINGKDALVTRDAQGEVVDAKGIGGGGTTNNVNVTNVPEGFEPTKPTLNALQKTVFDTGNQLARLQTIKANFDPEFLTATGRFGDFWRRGKDYFNKASPEEKDEITRHARFRQASGNQVNMTIKELSGVAVSNQEAQRLQIPEAWYGERNKPWTGMAPTEFYSNLQGKLRDIASVHARARYMLRTMNVSTGTNFTQEEIADMAKNDSFPVDYEDMPIIMDRRIDELIEAGYEDAEIEQRMIEEFGMVSLPEVE